MGSTAAPRKVMGGGSPFTSTGNVPYPSTSHTASSSNGSRKSSLLNPPSESTETWDDAEAWDETSDSEISHSPIKSKPRLPSSNLPNHPNEVTQ